MVTQREPRGPLPAVPGDHRLPPDQRIHDATGAEDPAALRTELVKQYEDTLANPYIAAERGYVDAVIAPSATRAQVTLALRTLRSKRETLPPKKHGNIPL